MVLNLEEFIGTSGGTYIYMAFAESPHLNTLMQDK
jgi:hypothetical protein